MDEAIKYDRSSPLVQAIEKGYEEWELTSDCKETGCGCVTVYIHREVVKLLSEKALALARAVATQEARTEGCEKSGG